MCVAVCVSSGASFRRDFSPSAGLAPLEELLVEFADCSQCCWTGTSGKDKHAKPGNVLLSAGSDFGEKHLKRHPQRRSISGGSQAGQSSPQSISLCGFSSVFSLP